MTTYNGEKYLREQLDSIILQSFSDFELIICDDVSDDKTVDILKEYEKKDSRIHVYINQTNLGFLKNFEKAISFCKGEYIAFCDQDDIWLPNHLEILLKSIQDKDVCGANAILVDANNKDMGTNICQIMGINKLPVLQDDFAFSIFFQNYFQGTAMLVKTEFLRKNIPFPEDIKFHDWWLALCGCFEDGVVYIKEPILRYRQHSNNVTTNEKEGLMKSLRGLFHRSKENELINQRILLYNNLNLKYKNANLVLGELNTYFTDSLCRKRKTAFFLYNQYERLYLNNNTKMRILRFIKKILLG